MEDIGSYIELEFTCSGELFSDVPVNDIIRLNTCRAAIYHAARCYGVNKIWIAKYQCDVVRDFLLRKGLEVFYYDIDEQFNPLLQTNSEDSAIVLTNYFGVLGDRHFDALVPKYHNVIIDNAQAFFYPPREDSLNCYSPRKFVAAPDGAYVIGSGVNRFRYDRDVSSNTSQFLLMRYEYGCDGEGYKNKKNNDKRIDESDIKLMSSLTLALLRAVDYESVKKRRLRNYQYARELFDDMNKLDTSNVFDDDCIPMGYPLWTNCEIIPEFHKKRIFQARYWEYLINEKASDSLEYNFAKYITLLCTDQRYGFDEINWQYQIIMDLLKNG